ncbi:hypothetical protein, partial [Citrobacter youngae]|uniref:hypothetical protein n=1 Tax=Citrobacter youngae TaxID=133448 RepID=UPI001953E7BC
GQLSTIALAMGSVNIRSARYITHIMLQPPNQLTYPLHIRTILQKNKEQKWNVIGQFIQKLE